jgi:hypothetical protein
MRNVLVVAHHTLVGDALQREVRAMLADKPYRFHLLVPVVHPGDHLWTDGEVEAAAHKRLEEGLAKFRDIGAEVTGEIGDVNTVMAVMAWLRQHQANEIIVSTLPPGVSRWLRLDVVNRITRAVDIPVTHVIYDEARVGA